MQPTASLAVLIYNFAGMPFENQVELAWAAALVLVLIVLVVQPRRPELWPDDPPYSNGDPVMSIVDKRRCHANATRTGRRASRSPAGRRDRLPHQGAPLRQVQGRARPAIPIKKNTITAFIGPSGCGKSTVLRCLNRMNDLVRGFRFEGHVQLPRPGHLRRQRSIRSRCAAIIGMVFQQPNPFATSIYNNVAFGLRLNGYKGNTAEKGRAGAAPAALWDEVKDKLQKSGLVALRRPAAAAVHRPRDRDRAGGAADGRAVLGARSDRHAPDRRADARAQEALHDRDRHPQPAAGPARRRHTGFLYVDTSQGGRTGYLVEFGQTQQIFENPREEHTKEYIRGEFS